MTSSPEQEPAEEYLRLRDRFRNQEQLLERRFVAIGNWRLAIGIGTAILAWFVFGRQSIGARWLLVSLVFFAGLVVWHQRVIRQRTFAARAVRFYERGLARLRDKWAGTGSTGDRFRDPSHVYSEDLDLFGKGSLFELVSIARTEAGENLLANWLLRPAALADTLERQAAVQELAPNLPLREDIALLAADVISNVNAETLRSWGTAPRVRFSPLIRPLGLLLAIGGISALFGFFFLQAIPLWPLAVLLICDFALIYTLRARVNAVLESVENSGRDLQIFAALLGRLEREQFQSPLLARLRADLNVQGTAASTRISRLRRLTDWLDSSDHILLRAVRPLILFREQLAISFERWRAASGDYVGRWVESIAEFEALSSFASLAFERPAWTVPVLLAESAGRFEAEALCHPLIASAECIPNDLSLGGPRRLLIVSGSNMSGKSTLLRAVGLNTVLAWAGAPVPAARLELSCLEPGASIRINDSLQDHRSRFLAEISRIRQIVDLTRRGHPVLFLLDEVLSGTNSHDRRIGALGIVRELLASHAIGLITTHDLALAQIEEDLGPGVGNVHFEDHMEDGEMRFDYKLKPGVVTRSNAIELMRAIGLHV